MTDGYSLLDDPIFSTRFIDHGASSLSLPEILHALTQNEVLGFEALQPHQQQPWYSFLVQLAAMAVARENSGQIPRSKDEWHAILLKLAHNNANAWKLVVDDLSQPAFMQSPVPEGTLKDAKYKADVSTPDELDMLLTSKNHDLKSRRITQPSPEHWIYALLTLQTMEGFMGRGNYGIVRMNGGYGSRPMIGLAGDLSWGQRFLRDTRLLINHRSKYKEEYDLDGHTLLWLHPWSGGKKEGLSLNQCDPYFIEICRRIRFTNEDSSLQCWRTNTKGNRIDAPDDLNGRTGDPWTPVEKNDAKALSIGENGFTYELLQKLLLGGEYQRPISLEFQEGEEGGFLIAKALARGQGKTDGLHERIIPIPSNVVKLFQQPSEREKLGQRARNRVSLADKVRRKVLNPAIGSLLSGGKNKNVKYESKAPWLNRFDRAIDHRFFESLWTSLEKSDQEARSDWENILREEAKNILDEAERSTPIAAIHRWRAISSARSIFYGNMNRIFEPTENDDHSKSTQTTLAL